MDMFQLVTVTDGTSAHHVVPVQNPDNRSFLDFETKDRRAVLWGSQDLVDLALRLVRNGFRATGATLADEKFRDVDASESGALVEEVLSEINSAASDNAEEALSETLNGLYVMALTLAKRQPRGGTFRLAQNGQVELIGDADESVLLGELQRVLVDQD
jgi:hypothetical protein